MIGHHDAMPSISNPPATRIRYIVDATTDVRVFVMINHFPRPLNPYSVCTSAPIGNESFGLHVGLGPEFNPQALPAGTRARDSRERSKHRPDAALKQSSDRAGSVLQQVVNGKAIKVCLLAAEGASAEESRWGWSSGFQIDFPRESAGRFPGRSPAWRWIHRTWGKM